MVKDVPRFLDLFLGILVLGVEAPEQTPQLYLHFDGLDGERISLEGAFDGDVVSGVGDEGVGIGDLVDFVADDEDGGGASLDALGGAVGAIRDALKTP